MNLRQAILVMGVLCGDAAAATIDPAPMVHDWAGLADLPDWSGVWLPELGNVGLGTGVTKPDWTPGAARLVGRLQALNKAGHPANPYTNCLPEGAVSQTLMTSNAEEYLFTPGRVTILGEADGNRLRRIYTDGRQHSADPDLTFNGESIGHWEGGTLVVDTIGILPEVFIVLSNAVGIPNNGGMHLIEHISLTAPNTLTDDLVVIAPHVLKTPWHAMRRFHRTRDRDKEIEEGSCRDGDFYGSADADGNAVFVPYKTDASGDVLP